MANHPSALKRHRQSEKRRLRNQALKSRLRHIVRDARSAVASGDSSAATTTVATAIKALDKAVTKGVVHRNNAARKASRLARAANKLSAKR